MDKNSRKIMYREQKLQEEQYILPYHWFLDVASWRGRVYYSCIKKCLDLFLAEAKGMNEPRILDAGCGDGFILGELKKLGFKDLYGVDYSEKAVNFAKLLVPEAKFSVDDLSSLSYPDGFFGAIFLVDVLEHILSGRLEVVLKSIHRVLSRGGILIVSVPSIAEPIGQKRFQHFSEESIKSFLSGLFSIQKIVGQNKKTFLEVIYKILDNRF